MSTPPAAPARPDRNEQLNALRRQLIMDAAQRVFERDGLEKTTIRAIASEAGCTTGAVIRGSPAKRRSMAPCWTNRCSGCMPT